MIDRQPGSALDLPHPGYAPPVAPPAVRWICLAIMAAVVFWLGQRGGLHILRGDPDFTYFYEAGRWLWTHGALDPGYDMVDGQVIRRGTLAWYLPSVPRILTLIAWLPYQAAGFVWVAVNLAALVATLRLIGRHLTGLPPRDWPVTQLLTVVLLLPFWLWEFRLNQINTLTLLLMVGSFTCWQRGKRAAGGFWLGLAVLLKLTPALLLFWFLLKRQWRTTAAAVVTIVLAGPVSDLCVLRPEETASAYRAWAQRALREGSGGGIVLAQTEMDWRNQGLPAVCSRWLHATSYHTRLDNDPRLAAKYTEQEPRYFNIVNLAPRTVARVVLAVSLASVAGLAWLARRPAAALSAWQLRFEWALFLVAMLWLMPVMRRYHLVWLAPALGVLGGAMQMHGYGRAWTRLAAVCIGVVALSELALLSRPVEARGALLAGVVFLAVPMVVMVVRRPATRGS